MKIMTLDSVELQPSQAESVRRRSEEEHAPFDALLSLLADERSAKLNPSREDFDLVVQANQRALTHQRLTEDDLRRVDEELTGRQRYLSAQRHPFQGGAVDLARQESIKHATPSADQTVSSHTAGKFVSEFKSGMGHVVENRFGLEGMPTNTSENISSAIKMTGDKSQSSSSAAVIQPSTTTSTPVVGQPMQSVAGESIGGSNSKFAAGTTSPIEAVSGNSSTTNAGPGGHEGLGQGQVSLKSGSSTNAVAKNHAPAGENFKLTPEAGEKTLQDVLKVLRASLGSKHSTLKLQLSPPELGRLTVDLRMDGDELRVRIETDNQQVKELLASKSSLLSEALDDRGIQVVRMEIVVSPPPEHNSADSQAPASWSGGADAQPGSDFDQRENDSNSRMGNTEFENDEALESDIENPVRLDIRV